MKPLMSLTFAALIFVLSGCNTVQGFGKDMEKAGAAIEKKASN